LRGRARRNVAHHYDLDSRLYSLFLDSDRQYSCAYFENPQDSLDDAQLAKKRHVAAKLLLEEGPPARTSRKTDGFSRDRRKPDLRGTAWWAHKDSVVKAISMT
jgi:hypothetical protein